MPHIEHYFNRSLEDKLDSWQYSRHMRRRRSLVAITLLSGTVAAAYIVSPEYFVDMGNELMRYASRAMELAYDYFSF